MFRRINKKQLKEDTEFYDYKTAPVDLSKGDVIDISKTGFSYYDDYLTNEGQKYLYDKTGTIGKIVQMSPNEYYDYCSKIFNKPVSKLKAGRAADEETIKHLKDVLTVYKKKFPLPYVNLADDQQEGLHRMMVIGDLFGWDHKVPVLYVDYADGEREKRETEKSVTETHKEIRDAVKKALEYRYNDIDEIANELEFIFDDNNFDISFDMNNNSFTVERNGVKDTFSIDEINIKDYDYDSDMDYIDWKDVLSDVDIDKMSPKEFDDYLKKLAK